MKIKTPIIRNFLGLGLLVINPVFLPSGANDLVPMKQPELKINSTKSSQLTNLGLIEDTWKNLNQLYSNSQQTCPEEITWLPQLGLRGLYCHIKPKLPYSKLQQLAQVNIFLKGPHSNSQLTLDAEYEFGYYNPAFVKWLADDSVGSLTDNSVLVNQTKSIYEKYLQRQARTYYLSYQILFAEPELLKRKQDKYIQLIQSQTLPPLYLQEEFRNIADHLESQGYNWYEANTAGSFWLRRSIDGTAKDFWVVIEKLLKAYDPDFLEQKKSSLPV